MRTHSNVTEINAGNTNIFELLPEELSEEYSYGLEYIIDDIMKENELQNPSYDQPVDWFGLYDDYS